MCTAWFGLGALIVLKKLDSKLSTKEKVLWKVVLFGYPLLESAIKTIIFFNLIPYSYRPLNLAEHFMWSVAMTLLLYPLVRNYLSKNMLKTQLILLFGIIIIIGNLNELFEFGLRMSMSLTSERLFAQYYLDTIIDLGINMVGGALTVVVLWLFHRQRVSNTKLQNSQIDFGN
jgi:hypothetical protein